MPYVPSGLALDPNDNIVNAFSSSPSRGAALESIIQSFRPRPENIPGTLTPSIMAWLSDNQAIVYSAAAVLVLLAVIKGRR